MDLDPKMVDADYLEIIDTEERESKLSETIDEMVELTQPEALRELTVMELGAVRQLTERGIEHRAKLGLFSQATRLRPVLAVILAEIDRRG